MGVVTRASFTRSIFVTSRLSKLTYAPSDKPTSTQRMRDRHKQFGPFRANFTDAAACFEHSWYPVLNEAGWNEGVRGGGVIVPQILKMNTSLWWLVSRPSCQLQPIGQISRYSLDRKLSGPMSKIEPKISGSPARNPVNNQWSPLTPISILTFRNLASYI